MNGLHCGGEMVRGSAPLYVGRNGCHVVLDTVPAWVRGQCGEAYFDEAEADAIQALIQSADQNAQRIAAAA